MGDGIFGTDIDLSGLDEQTAYRLGLFMGEQILAAKERGRQQGWRDGLLRAAADLRLMACDPADYLTATLGPAHAARVELWLRDQAAGGVRCPRDGLHEPGEPCPHPWHSTEGTQTDG